MPSSPSKPNRRPSQVQPPISQKLRPVSPEELGAWSDNDSDSTLTEPLPDDLDESWPYTFQTGQAVWVRTAGGNWMPGVIFGETTRKGQTREVNHIKEGLFYPVKFDGKLRKYFAPLNGEIKPDTPHTKRLLKDAGWL